MQDKRLAAESGDRHTAPLSLFDRLLETRRQERREEEQRQPQFKMKLTGLEPSVPADDESHLRRFQRWHAALPVIYRPEQFQGGPVRVRLPVSVSLPTMFSTSLVEKGLECDQCRWSYDGQEWNIVQTLTMVWMKPTSDLSLGSLHWRIVLDRVTGDFRTSDDDHSISLTELKILDCAREEGELYFETLDIEVFIRPKDVDDGWMWLWQLLQLLETRRGTEMLTRE